MRGGNVALPAGTESFLLVTELFFFLIYRSLVQQMVYGEIFLIRTQLFWTCTTTEEDGIVLIGVSILLSNMNLDLKSLQTGMYAL